ncbi:MAG: hypothetical protein ACLQVA_02575 [Candidatus Brocadiia bacterium]
MAMQYVKHNPLFMSAPRNMTALQRMQRNKAYQYNPLICSKCRKEKAIIRNLCRGCLLLFG